MENTQYYFDFDSEHRGFAVYETIEGQPMPFDIIGSPDQLRAFYPTALPLSMFAAPILSERLTCSQVGHGWADICDCEHFAV
ncbi:MAG TPA: hypothetical protein VI522_02725 [Gammaproteobacteria bacterium]|nr:hypothetical protein [Gammaproteobacteria bacterium]